MIGMRNIAAGITAVAAITLMANSAGAVVRPAEHSPPTVDDTHAAEADEKMVVEVGQSESPLQDALSPFGTAWLHAPSTTIPLYAQSIVAPTGGGSTAEVTARALRTKSGMLFRLEWNDATQDDGKKDSKFKDGAAIEFPVDSSGDTRLSMGHSGGAVNILHWTAETSTRSKDQQAEELVAAGIYNRARKEPKFQQLQCRASWRNNKWTMVIFKPFNSEDTESPKFDQGDTPMAIAIWNGHAGERLGMKSLSNWLLLRVK
jgi:DMSO reductase family type II enzyme heme b subunit